jgi:hypothetical protein
MANDREAFDYLKNWAVIYIRHRDIALKKIAAIKDSADGFTVENSDGSRVQCLVSPTLKDVGRQALGANPIIFTLSNQSNVQEIYKAWNSLAQNRNLLIILANPFSKLEEKWVLKPYLHNQVCDSSSLLLGLKAMAELVEPLDEQGLILNARQSG